LSKNGPNIIPSH